MVRKVVGLIDIVDSCPVTICLGEVEMDGPPPRLTPSQPWRRVKHFPKVTKSGVTRMDGYGEWHNWTKRSIFWDLPYWKDNLLRHRAVKMGNLARPGSTHHGLMI